MKKFRKLIPALALLLVSAVLMSTASYAWFSMNNKVTVTGMEVKTKVSSNLFVRVSELNTHIEDDSNYHKDVTQPVTGLLQPVSTVDGVNFYYVDASNDVNADGRIKSGAIYEQYADSDDFHSANGQPTSVPYVDYVIELKAINTTSDSQTLRLTELKLTYTDSIADPTATENAYRVAVFMQKYDGSNYTGTTNTLESILKESSAEYFTGSSAVVSSSAVGSVTNLSEGVEFSVSATGSPEYYQVIVRLWLEGEDTTCKNETYANLDEGNWKLDLAFELGTSTAATTVVSSDYVNSSANP